MKCKLGLLACTKACSMRQHKGMPMRWLVRLLVFWAISAPLFYLFGLPFALDLLSKKAQSEALAQCREQMVTNGMAGRSDSPLSAVQSDNYCHCVSDGLLFTKDDLRDVVMKKQPAALNALAQSLASKCNDELNAQLQHLTPNAPLPPATDGSIPIE